MLLCRQLLVSLLVPVLLQDVGPSPRAAETGAAEEGAETERSSPHAGWDRLLKTYVTEEGWVDYAGLRREGLSQLGAYLAQLARRDVATLGGGDAEKAFWINAYNAICVQTLIDHKLPKEVPHAFFFGANIFTERTYVVAGKKRSLDDIEHGILRKRFKDERIHAAVVCGASSCPRLRPEAYEGAELDRQLDEEARRWIGVGRDKESKRKNYLDRGAGVFYASKIFDWYMEDFGGSEAGVAKFIQRFASPDVREFMSSNRVRIKYLPYDWRLNSR